MAESYTLLNNDSYGTVSGGNMWRLLLNADIRNHTRDMGQNINVEGTRHSGGIANTYRAWDCGKHYLENIGWGQSTEGFECQTKEPEKSYQISDAS